MPAYLLTGTGNVRGEEGHPEKLSLATVAIWQHGTANIFLCFDVSIKRFISVE